LVTNKAAFESKVEKPMEVVEAGAWQVMGRKVFRLAVVMTASGF